MQFPLPSKPDLSGPNLPLAYQKKRQAGPPPPPNDEDAEPRTPWVIVFQINTRIHGAEGKKEGRKVVMTLLQDALVGAPDHSFSMRQGTEPSAGRVRVKVYFHSEFFMNKTACLMYTYNLSRTQQEEKVLMKIQRAYHPPLDLYWITELPSSLPLGLIYDLFFPIASHFGGIAEVGRFPSSTSPLVCVAYVRFHHFNLSVLPSDLPLGSCSVPGLLFQPPSCFPTVDLNESNKRYAEKISFRAKGVECAWVELSGEWYLRVDPQDETKAVGLGRGGQLSEVKAEYRPYVWNAGRLSRLRLLPWNAIHPNSIQPFLPVTSWDISDARPVVDSASDQAPSPLPSEAGWDNAASIGPQPYQAPGTTEINYLLGKSGVELAADDMDVDRGPPRGINPIYTHRRQLPDRVGVPRPDDPQFGVPGRIPNPVKPVPLFPDVPHPLLAPAVPGAERPAFAAQLVPAEAEAVPAPLAPGA